MTLNIVLNQINFQQSVVPWSSQSKLHSLSQIWQNYMHFIL